MILVRPCCTGQGTYNGLRSIATIFHAKHESIDEPPESHLFLNPEVPKQKRRKRDQAKSIPICCTKASQLMSSPRILAMDLHPFG